MWGIALAYYFNYFFKYTNTADFYICLLIRYGVPHSLLLLQASIDHDTEHLMAVQTLFPKGAILDIWDASKVNYFDADKGKIFICRAFIKTDMVLFCLYVKFSHNLFSNDFLHSCFIQFFFIKAF